MGLSPRVRGNRWMVSLAHDHNRSIPACAGEPPMPREEEVAEKVYPRGCGGTAGPRMVGADSEGLSPRVRGNRGAADGRG